MSEQSRRLIDAGMPRPCSMVMFSATFLSPEAQVCRHVGSSPIG
ncbi:TPA: hypothetical protein ACXN24_001703 [Proteus mirabilis]